MRTFRLWLLKRLFRHHVETQIRDGVRDMELDGSIPEELRELREIEKEDGLWQAATRCFGRDWQADLAEDVFDDLMK